ISTGCAQCHGGAAALTFYNNNDNPKSAVLSPPHIPAFAGTDCSSCHASGNYATGGFGPMNMTQASHAALGRSCNACHEAGLSFYMGAANPGLQGRPADHTTGQMVSPNDCSLCHSTANWNSTALPAGHMPNPGNQACAVCHTAAPGNYTTLAANPVLHTGITAGCATCHGGATALTWYNNFTPKDGVLTPPHIPYLSGTDCGSCHSSGSFAAGGFGPMNMTQGTHAFVVTTCVTCHESGRSFYLGAANPGLQGRPADHTSGQMVAPNDCNLCHTTANWNSTALPAGHMPNPGNQACAVCHKSAPADYSTATLAANTVLHTGITSGCVTCHGAPSATPPVFYNNFTPKSAVLSPVHIPTSTTACESCHASSIFTAFSGTTMSAAKHTLMLSVTGGTCDQCHDLSTLKFFGVTNLTTRPNGHHVGKDCNGCHSPNNWGGGSAKKSVSAQTATRSSIGIVVSSPAGAATTASASTTASAAVSASATANASKTVSTVQPGTRAIGLRPSHAGVTANCVSCHDGVLAMGKATSHITSNSACQNCHTTIAWLPARFDHRAITGSCAGCHNAVLALGKPTQHVQTLKDCSACHGTITWAAATFSHLGLNAACQSCHNGSIATAKQPQHLATALDCGSCHNTLTWTVVSSRPRPRTLIPSPRGAGNGSTK
ncbi:MAG TPA: hypothetical protein VNX69_09005, partial [Steroidobacteraceae bacterium]|nr:hypothetical protein [Steroidobacteraceae bacterium]